jgi:hypothetical protein
MYNIICQQITNACGQSIPILGILRMNCTDALNSGVGLESMTYQVFPKNSLWALKNWMKLPPKHAASVAESPHTPLTSGFKPSEVEAVEVRRQRAMFQQSLHCAGFGISPTSSSAPGASSSLSSDVLAASLGMGGARELEGETMRHRPHHHRLYLRRQERVGRRDDGFLISSSGT